MIELTWTKVNELLDAAVAEKGADYVYQDPDGRRGGEVDEDGCPAAVTCRYVHGDKPGCIVGNVLHRAGVSLSALRDEEGVGAYNSMFERLYVSMPTHASDLLAHVQDRQDVGVPWGDAVREAREQVSQ
jgi:hypothetical protein